MADGLTIAQRRKLGKPPTRKSPTPKPTRETADERDRRRAREKAEERRAEFDAAMAPARVDQAWAVKMLAYSAEDGLREMVEQGTRLHNAALTAGEVKHALDCLRFVADLLGYRRDISDVTRDAAKKSPEERVRAALADPIHGPMLRAAVLAERGQRDGND